MRVLVLSRYVAQGASSRLRMLQYVAPLSCQGFVLSEAPLLDEAYLAAIYAGRAPGVVRLLQLYWRRLRLLLAAGRFDLVWVEKELWPWAPAWLECLLLRRLGPTVLDFDDAVFHNYDRHPRRLCRFLYANKIARLMRAASCVVAGSRYVLDYARQAGAAALEYVPTVIDLARYQVRPAPSAAQDVLVVGWIGTPFTVKYLQQIIPALASLARDGLRIQLRVIGAPAPQIVGVDSISIAWAEDTEADEIACFDVGVMPLEDSPWERGKCAYKLIQYMACGVPVIASPVGMNAEVVVAEESGLLADTVQAWVDALKRMAQDPALRQCLGRQGRERVEAHYSLQVAAPRLAELFNRIAKQGGAPSCAE